MNLFFLHHPAPKKDPSGQHGPAHHEPIHDQSEGSEYIDDAIRQEDVIETPVNYTEESLEEGELIIYSPSFKDLRNIFFNSRLACFGLFGRRKMKQVSTLPAGRQRFKGRA